MKPTNPGGKICALLIAALLLSTTFVHGAGLKNRTRRIRFERGRTTTVIKDAVVRGDRDRYILHARAGQNLIVHITSLESNAVFDIYRPGGKRTLPNAEESTDWEGSLPRTGDYIIEVGGTRGNATYTLEVTIR